MTILWVSLILVFSFSIMARYFAVPAPMSVTYIQPNKILAAAAALVLMLVAGLRNNIGDTFLYMHAYEVNTLSWDTFYMQKDMGFVVLQLLLKQITEDPQILIFTTAFITNMLIAIVLYKYSRLYELSMYVYITSGAFTVSMNGLRQFLAAAIIFAATKALFDGRWKVFFSVVILASFLHQSALIMLPIYFIVRRKAWTVSTFALLALAVAFVGGFEYISDLVFKVLQNTQYGHYSEFDEGGANIIRVFVSGIPIFIAYLGRHKLREIFPESDIVVNLSFVALTLMIISTQNWIFARMTIFFNLYVLILIGWLVKLFREKEQRLVYLGILSFYFIFYYFESVVSLGLYYSSDYITWFK